MPELKLLQVLYADKGTTNFLKSGNTVVVKQVVAFDEGAVYNAEAVQNEKYDIFIFSGAELVAAPAWYFNHFPPEADTPVPAAER